MCIDAWQNGSAMWVCENRGVTGRVGGGCERGRSISSRTGAKENGQTDILEASLPEGHRIIDFHEGTAEVDRIQGGKTAERQDRGDGAQGAGISARCPYSGNGGMAGMLGGAGGRRPIDAKGECCRRAASVPR